MIFPPRYCRLLFPLALALVVAGCASAPKAGTYSIKVEVAPSLAGSSIQVDMIGANTLSDLPKWRTYSVTEYWQPYNAQRRDAEKHTMQFGPGRSNVQTLSSSDPIWGRWISTGAMHLVVLVNLPGVTSDREGNADPRRLIVPLDLKQWPSNAKTLELRIQESGVRLLTQMKSS